MYPIQEQRGDRGIGMGYDRFIDQFNAICQEHLHARRARAFAFVFYNMEHGVVRQALREHGFRALHERTGNDITLFYLHDSAVDKRSKEFNSAFMSALGIEDQAEPPCMVFFRVLGEEIEDVSIYKIDEQTEDPVLLAAELEQYVDEAKAAMRSEGNLSGLLDVVAPVRALVKLVSLVAKLKGVA